MENFETNNQKDKNGNRTDPRVHGLKQKQKLPDPGPWVPGSLGPWVPESLGPRVPWSLGPWVPGPLIWFVDKLLLNLHFMQSLQRIRSRE